MAIQKEFVLRYRHDGHVRFQVPAQVCQSAVAALISQKLSAVNGVQSVSLYRGQGKLSIRYDETICGFTSLAKQLFQMLAELEQQGHFESKPLVEQAKKSVLGIKKRLQRTRLGGWVSKKYQAGKETVQAAKIIGKVSTKGPKALFKDPEKATIDFLNDVLVLYLIKTHWTRITQEWLVKPIVHRYEWMAVLYMFFLLVRSRRPK
ncbi:hypothetical protein [Methylomonas albis]|uniref:Uncharacterized protein n=1 Tax=Methylomonas albis TaxID=1854563 RepID=A0ABR9D321_9GAMM|nr:hypothetical protein [Methylomonas albis]MBD9357508.1 hypothetical protein [Methylomonas albis]CAD6880786.1 hypothetical protein [Methylomonas albis]